MVESCLGQKKVRDMQRSCFTQLAVEQGRMEAEFYSCIQNDVIIMLSKSAADCLQMCMRMAAHHPVFQYLSYFNWKRFIQCSNPFKHKDMYFEWFRNFMMQFLSPIWSPIGIPIWRLTMLDMFDGDGAKRAPGDLSGPPWIGLNQTGDFIFWQKKTKNDPVHPCFEARPTNKK